MQKVIKAVVAGLAIVAVGVVGLVVFVGVRAARPVDAPLPDIQASTDPAVIARGEYLALGPSHCTACHLDRERAETLLQGDKPDLSGGYAWDLPGFGRFFSANITPDVDTGIGEWTDQEIARAIRAGVRRDGSLSLLMALGVGPHSDEDLVALVSYLRSRAPVKKENPASDVGPLGQVLLAFSIEPRLDPPPPPSPAADTPSQERGAYLANGPAMCASCHSKRDVFSNGSLSRRFGGGDPQPSDVVEGMEIVAPNITSHATGRFSSWTLDTLTTRVRGAKLIPSSPMPWIQFGNMTSADLESIYLYLKSVPPVAHDVGETFRNVEL